MPLDNAKRITTKTVALVVFALYAGFGWALYAEGLPMWALALYMVTGAVSLVSKAMYIGIPGTRRFRENILA